MINKIIKWLGGYTKQEFDEQGYLTINDETLKRWPQRLWKYVKISGNAKKLTYSLPITIPIVLTKEEIKILWKITNQN